MHPPTRLSSMSLVADGPLIQFTAGGSQPGASASGTVPTTWSGRTTQTCRSGRRLTTRRPWHAEPSSTTVPVSARQPREGSELSARR